VRLNRLFVKHLVDLFLLAGQQELAFRGYDEHSTFFNKGNFKELFYMHFRSCTLEIQNHFNNIQNRFSGVSKVIQKI